MNWSAWSAPRNELINKDFHTNSLHVLCVSIVHVWQSGKALGSPERRADAFVGTSEDSALMRRAQGLRGFNGIDGFTTILLFDYFTV